MRKTADLHVVDTRALAAPATIHAEFPLGDAASELVGGTRDRIRDIVHGRDKRLLVVVGPCSIHDPVAAREYGRRLVALREKHANELEIVMRVYFEKPRTTVGWKGLINDPHLDGSFDINTGLRMARRLLLELADMGMPAATELLDPIIPQYLADVVAWTAIGARTTESQTHREMASGLSMPVGFKNGTDGGLSAAVNAMVAAKHAHHFLGINAAGLASIVTTSGNPDGHLVLRGGKHGPNFEAEPVAKAVAELATHKMAPRVMIDCSHDNAAKDHTRQAAVAASIAAQVAAGTQSIMGVMIESHLVAGRQDAPPFSKKAPPKGAGDPRAKLVYGQSITDACVDFAGAESMLESLSLAVSARAARERVTTESARIEPLPLRARG